MKTLNWCFGAVLAGAFLPMAAVAEEEIDYARGYEACENGGSSDGSNPKAYEEGCEDARNGDSPRYGTGDGGEQRARKACQERAVEGSSQKAGDAEVIESEVVGSDRFRFEIKAHSGNISCTANGEGEVFSTDEI